MEKKKPNRLSRFMGGMMSVDNIYIFFQDLKFKVLFKKMSFENFTYGNNTEYFAFDNLR